MSRGRWIVLILVALWIYSYARKVAREMKAAQEHAEKVANADSMIGIAGKVISYIFG
jgi:preprotein translocase subunit YajC